MLFWKEETFNIETSFSSLAFTVRRKVFEFLKTYCCSPPRIADKQNIPSLYPIEQVIRNILESV